MTQQNPLEEELVTIGLGGGLDESAEDLFVPFDRMRQCDDVVFPDANTAVTRQGLTTLGTLPYAQRLIKRGSEVLATDGHDLYAWVQERAAFVSRGRVSPCAASRGLLVSGNYDATAATQTLYPLPPLTSIAEDSVTHLQVRAYTDGLNLGARVVDPSDESVLLETWMVYGCTNQQPGLVNQPRTCIVASRAFVFYWDTNNATQLRQVSIDLTNIAGGWTAPVVVPSVTMSSSAAWDATVNSGAGGQIAVVVATGTTVKLTLLGVSGATLTNLFGGPATVETIGGSPTLGPATVYATNLDGIMVAYAYSTTAAGVNTYNLRWASYTGALVVHGAPATIATDSEQPTAELSVPRMYVTLGIVQKSDENPGTDDAIFYIVAGRRGREGVYPSPTLLLVQTNPWNLPCTQVIVTKKVGGAQRLWSFQLGWQTASKPFALMVRGTLRMFFLAKFSDGARESTAQVPLTETTVPTLVLVELDREYTTITGDVQKPCAVLAPGFSGTADHATMDPAVRTSAGLVAASVPGWEEDVSGRTSGSSVALDWQAVNLWQAVELGPWAWIAGGMPMIYDGSSSTEVHFVHPPPKPTVVAQALFSIGVALTTYSAVQYICRYVQQDPAGNLHFSAPSQPSDALDCSGTVGGASGNGAERLYIQVAACRMTHRMQAQTGGIARPIQVEFYRNSAATPDVWQYVGRSNVDPTVPHVVFVDTTAEPFGAANPPLYTTGGDVPSNAAPAQTALTVHANRVIGIDEDGRTAWYTSELVSAECPRYTDAFTLTWPQGPILAMWSLEQRLHAGTDSSFAYVLGSGPSITGAGIDWTQPQTWQDDVGIQDARGIAPFGGGMVLATRRGLYVEGRDGSLVWMGRRFRRTLEAVPIVTSIVPLTEDGAVRISLAAAEGADALGATIHWDYRWDRIARHLRPSAAAIVSAVVAGGAWYGLQLTTVSSVPTGRLLVEDATTNLDDGAFVAPTLKTGWLTGAGQLGSQRVHRALLSGTWITAHGLSILSETDTSTSFASTWTFDEVAAFKTPLEQVRYTPPVQKCARMSFTLQSTAPPGGSLGVGTGIQWQSLAARVRVRRGEKKSLTVVQQR